ncbi:alpha/beta hydrolase [Luteipulveratus sp. YIM 133132]|uniref:Alpha/beta hydrolase n=1 Tax=Luteipulveratus flavus TaxID=3031728 RepID=A0ABT6C6A6_9MICO|nr:MULTISPECIES: alpha/beta hydrolase [unclassified Luteipulveratus]MDE9365229.1 alpha/beta hydrolase [Luteipulveratus sp. YIM 133132]MDF8264434.1 alpha/beta hydrolase [Luteipulveratus sp. YIM 133296]
MTTTTTGSVTLHYQDTGGSGRPVVLIHGWPLSGEAWKDNIPVLRDGGYRVIAYDRRGFGQSDKPATGYGYDDLADDLANLMTELDLRDVTLVGFSMGGGEVVRYLARHGAERVHSVVLASAVTPYLMKGGDNPDGPLTKAEAAKMAASLTTSSDTFYDGFITDFFSAHGELVVSEDQRQEAIELCRQASKVAALQAMTAFGTTDFRDDLAAVTVPALVIHGDADATVPFKGSGRRTHESLPGSELVLVEGGPHGINVSHQGAFHSALLDFLQR